MTDESKFKIYSVAIVAEPKALNSFTILAHPIETIPFFDGEIRSNPISVTDTGVDKNGANYAMQVSSDNTIKATWLCLGSENRSTPPDVRRGERVLLYRYAANDTFYWTSMGLDKGLRRLETVITRYSGHTDEKSTVLTDDNSYWFEVSTHKGSITLNTSKQNGEKVMYGLKLDPKNGTVTLKDDNGNRFFMDSIGLLMEMVNKDQSIIRIDKKTALIDTKESITLNSKFIKINGSETVNVKTKEHTLDATNSTATLTSTLTIKAKSIIAKATTFAVTALSSFKGNVGITGNLSTTGNVSNDGTLTSGGKNVGATHLHSGGTLALGKTGIPD